MNQLTPVSRRNNLRAFIAALITYFMLAGQLAPLATARPTPAPKASPTTASDDSFAVQKKPSVLQSRPAPPPPGGGAPSAPGPVVTASKTDNRTSAQPANPGDTINYTVTITNTGPGDASNVQFNDSVDNNTTLVAGSGVLAADDDYNTIGNVQISVAAPGLLANDLDVDAASNAGMTASGGTTSAQGGTVAISSNGSFTYDPPTGFTGTDTFTYTATTSGGKTADATAHVTVAGKIWFVNVNAGACSSNCDGRLSHPFTTLANFQAINDNGAAATHAKTGDNIFLYQSATSYVGPVTLLNSQKLIGQDATASLITITGLTQPSGTDPLPAMNSADGTKVNITTTAPSTNAIQIPNGNSNVLRGFTVGNTTGAKIITTGAGFGTLTVGDSTSPDVTLNGTGQALNLTSGSLGATSGFAGVTTTSSAGQGINLAGISVVGGGTVSFGSTTVSGAATQGILIGTTTASINFGNTSVTGGSDGVSFQNNPSGTRTFGTLGVSGGSGSAFLSGAGGGNVTVNGAATLSSTGDVVNIANSTNGSSVNFVGGATVTKTTTGGNGVNWSGTNTGATLTFATLALTTSNGTGMNLTGGGTINVTTAAGSSISTTGVGAQAAPAINASGVALGLNFTTVAATGGGSGTGQGITLASVSGSLTVNNGASTATNIQNTGGAGISVTSSSATLNFGNTTVNGSGGTGIVLGGSGTGNSGAATFGALSVTPDSGQAGINAQQNTGAITSASGTVTTTNATAVSIAGTSSAIKTPLNIQLTTVNTTGGAAAANGIILQNTSATGSPGGFRVLGNGGACTVATPTCTGGRITNTTGANGATAGNGVYLNTVDKVVLTRMHIDNHPNFALRGFTVTGFTMDTCLVDGANGNSAADFEGSIVFDGLFGTSAGSTAALITGSTIKGGFGDNLRITNTSGTLEATVTASTIRDTSTGTNGNDNLHIDAHTTANVTAHVTNNTFAATNGDHIQTICDGTATLTIVATGNTLSGGGGANALGEGITISGGDVNGGTDSTEHVNFNISNNTMSGTISGGAININEGVGNGTWQGQVSSNTVGVAASAGSGCSQCSDVRVENHSKGTLNAIVDSNHLHQYGVEGITLTAGDQTATGLGNGPLNVTVTNNVVDTPNNNPPTFVPDHGIFFEAGTQVNNSNVTCLDLKNNTSAGNPPQGGSDYRVRQRFGTTVKLPGYGGANNDNAAVISYILARPNTATNGTVTATNTVGVGAPLGPGNGFVNTPGGAQCAQPTVPTSPILADVTMVPKGVPASGSAGSGENLAASRKSGVTTRPFVSPIRSGVKAPAVVSRTVVPSSSGAKVGASASRAFTPVVRIVPGALTGGTVSANIGTLHVGDSVTINFSVTVNNPYSGGANVSNQGSVTGSNFSTVLTDDPDVGGASDPTLTPINATHIVVNDAKASEPASGTTQMLFTLTLTQPAPVGGLTVNFATADQTPGAGHATGGASCDGTSDYVTTSGTATVPAGSKITTIPVNVCADSVAGEPDETFLVNISSPSSGMIDDTQAVGTITQSNAAGTLLISELRTSGPGGNGNQFVELYNNTDSPVTLTPTDGSSGYGLFKMGADCNATPVLIAVIPAVTNLPARGHYLLVGSGYAAGALNSYAAGDQTLTSDIGQDGNVALFSTSNVANISSANRLDAVGFGTNTGAICDLMREGNTLPPVAANPTTEYSFFRKECDFVGGVGCTTPGNPKDTNDNSADFEFADTMGTNISGVPQRLGAPGPENLLTSPIRRDSTIAVTLLDNNVALSAPPNRVRDMAGAGNNTNFATFGTLSIRRRVVNQTGANVTRIRFRVVEVTTAPSPGGGVADVRALTSSDVVGVMVSDAGTCSPSAAPCTVTVKGTTLETPPSQPIGGGINSTLAVGSVTLAQPLAPNASVNVQFLLGVQQTGTFRFLIITEALP